MHPLPRTLVDGKMQIPKFASAMGYKTTGQVNGLLNRQGRSKSENGVEDTFAADDVRVTRLNAIADLVYAPHILDMESVGGLRMSLRHAYTEDALLVIQKEIGWRLTKTNDKKESVLLCWCASTAGFKLMAFRRSPDLARYILSHANMVVNGLNDAPTKALFYEPSIFKSYGRFNQASAAWMLRKMEHQNLLDADFLSRQHTVFCEVFDEISLLDKEVYRGPRSEALKAALETATYLKVVSSGSPPGRYANLLKAFGDHLNEARSKLATRWYLDSYIDMLEKHLGNGVVRGLPEWVRLIEFQAENDP